MGEVQVQLESKRVVRVASGCLYPELTYTMLTPT